MILLVAGLLMLLIFALGASIGSFTGVVIDRAGSARGIMSASTCQCGRKLHWYENVPVLGWLAAGGRARCCGARIPAWYLYLELVGGLIACIFAGLSALLALVLVTYL